MPPGLYRAIWTPTRVPMHQASEPASGADAVTDIRGILARILAAYEAEGFPADIIGQWTIPENDSIDLYQFVRHQRPKAILEVGTFVGLSTMLLALAAGRDAHVYTIDPNFPLSDEMGSMGSSFGSIDRTMRTHDVAAAVARRLGIEDRITFVAGGFSTGNTFTSRRDQPGKGDVPVVGPEVCEAHGPFDLAFIDGLHYADAVESDVRLASANVTGTGILVLHDCVGMWGTNVRTGVGRFLADNRDWRLLHPPYEALYRSLGVLFRPDVHPALSEGLADKLTLPAALHTVLKPFATTLRKLDPSRILEISTGPSVIRDLVGADIPTAGASLTVDGIDGIAAAIKGAATGTPTGKPALVVGIGLADMLPDNEFAKLLEAIAVSGVLAILVRTPPGERGAAMRFSRPLRQWLAMAQEAGAGLAALQPLDMAPSQFLFTTNTAATPDDSRLSSTVAIGAPGALAHILDAGYGASALLDAETADLAEQNGLLGIHYASGFGWAFKQLAETSYWLDFERDRKAELELSIGTGKGRVSTNERQMKAAQRMIRRFTDRQTEVQHALETESRALEQVSERVAGLENHYSSTLASLNLMEQSSRGLDADEGSSSGRSATRERLQIAHSEASEELETARKELNRLRREQTARRAQLDRLKRQRTLLETYQAHGPKLSPSFIRGFFSTLFINYCDTATDDLCTLAIAHSLKRGSVGICLMTSWIADEAEVDVLLRDLNVASVGVKDGRLSSLAKRHQADPRVGRYFHDGDWELPTPCEVVYFAGPWRLLTVAMIREAARRGVRTLWVRVGNTWQPLPVSYLRQYASHLRSLLRFRDRVGETVRRLVSATGLRRPLQKVTPPGLLLTMDEAFSELARNVPPARQPEGRRVTLVCGSLAPGGAERQVTYTAGGLVRSPVDRVELLAHFLSPGPAQHDFFLEDVRSRGVDARAIERVTQGARDKNLPEVLARVARALPDSVVVDIANLVREFHASKPDVVHTWLDWDNVRGGLAAALAGVPHILVSGRNLNPSHFDLYQPYMLPAYKTLASLPNVTFLNNSHAGAADYAAWLGLPASAIRVVHNAVHFDEASKPTESQTEALRASLGIPNESTVVGGAFRFMPEKRPLLWIDAAVRVAKERPDVHFVLFGHGELEGEMRARIDASGVAGRFHMPGVSNQILLALSLMDVFLLTSYGEGLPNVLLEAQYAGVPVVTTDAGGSAETLEEDVTGIVVRSSDPDEIARRLLDALANEAWRAGAHERGPAWVRSNFSVEKMVNETLAAYGFSGIRYTPHEEAAE